MESAEAGAVDLFPPPPSSVTVGSGCYVIAGVDPADERLDGARGITHFDPTAIFYDRTLSSRERFEVLWHELTHAVDVEFELLQVRKRLNEERVAHVHGKGWTQVFLDNPALVEWLDLVAHYIKDERENA